jgi:hypothetical protein
MTYGMPKYIYIYVGFQKFISKGIYYVYDSLMALYKQVS